MDNCIDKIRAPASELSARLRSGFLRRAINIVRSAPTEWQSFTALHDLLAALKPCLMSTDSDMATPAWCLVRFLLSSDDMVVELLRHKFVVVCCLLQAS